LYKLVEPDLGQESVELFILETALSRDGWGPLFLRIMRVLESFNTFLGGGAVIKIYTDGSYKSGFVGYAYSIYDNNELVVKNVIIRRPETSLKNVEAELLAVMAALTKLKELYCSLKGERVVLASDLTEVRNFYGNALKNQSDISNDQKNSSEKNSDATKEKKFQEALIAQFREIIRHLGCELSFEYVRGHWMNVLHNSVDSTLLRIINKRIATEKEIIANDKQSDKSGLVVAYLPSHIFSEFEFQYIKELHKILSETKSEETSLSIKLMMRNNGFVYEPHKSKLKRKFEELLEDAVRYKVLTKVGDEENSCRYKANNIKKIVYATINLRKETSEQIGAKTKSTTQNNKYESDYKNFLVNILKKNKKPMTVQQIKAVTIERKYPWRQEKSSGMKTFEALLEELVKEGRITKINGKYTTLS
jgi:ribonuclease HI